MAEIYTRQGVAVIIDDDDFDAVSEHTWNKYPSCRYVQANIDGQTVSIHRFVMGAAKGSTLDHINGNRLDNRKANLRYCNQAQNMKNRKPNSNGASAYKGVVVLPNGRFRAKINSDGVRYELGVYMCERDAVIAYNAAAKVLHGEFAYMNEIPENTRADGWISVEDRLPESDDEIFVVSCGEVKLCMFNFWSINPSKSIEQSYQWFVYVNIQNYGYEMREVVGVTHWMPLPELPKERA